MTTDQRVAETLKDVAFINGGSWPCMEDEDVAMKFVDHCKFLLALLSEKEMEIEGLRKLVYDIAQDGYLYYGPEGMTKIQEACYKISEEVRIAALTPPTADRKED